MDFDFSEVENVTPEALFEAGKLLFTGNPDVEMDLPKARALFQKAADRNYPEACANVGVMLLNGIGGIQDIDLGISYLEKGDKLGCLNSKWNLATLLLDGMFIKPDKEKAIHLLQQVYNPDAQYELSQVYRKDNRIDDSKDVLLKNLEKHSDHEDSIIGIGSLYYQTGDYISAKEYYLKVAAKDDNAKYNLACTYLELDDFISAEKWLIEASENKHHCSLLLLKDLYEKRGETEKYKIWKEVLDKLTWHPGREN